MGRSGNAALILVKVDVIPTPIEQMGRISVTGRNACQFSSSNTQIEVTLP